MTAALAREVKATEEGAGTLVVGSELAKAVVQVAAPARP